MINIYKTASPDSDQVCSLLSKLLYTKCEVALCLLHFGNVREMNLWYVWKAGIIFGNGFIVFTILERCILFCYLGPFGYPIGQNLCMQVNQEILLSMAHWVVFTLAIYEIWVPYFRNGHVFCQTCHFTWW